MRAPRRLGCAIFSEDTLKTSLTSRFLAGWEPAVFPSRGPDGLIPAPPPRSLPVLEQPSLCEAGPCRHYHRVASLMDAAAPIDGSASEAHEQIVRACYPAPGIELELGEAPVSKCSRWEPDNEQSRLDTIRNAYLRSSAGQAYTEQIQALEVAARATQLEINADEEAVEL